MSISPAKRRAVTLKNAAVLREINEKRMADGLCRHCGGAIPCWSPFGDEPSPGHRVMNEEGHLMVQAQRLLDGLEESK